MTTKSTDFKETMTAELTDFIQSQARALSLADLDRLIDRFAGIARTFRQNSVTDIPIPVRPA